MRKIRNFTIAAYVKTKCFVEYQSTWLLLLIGLVILSHSFAELSLAAGGGYDGAAYKEVCKRAITQMEGPVGAVVAAAAGVGAIVAASLGGFRMAWTLVVVSIGSFILGEYYLIFLPSCE